MEYQFRKIEEKWQNYWKTNNIYKVSNQSDRPKYYVLDMFPYPSGAGLHVGHPLGYIASDIFSRYKRLKGFNVLHPMGYDSFGLPAEQYAIEHGIHPAVSTAQNIKNFRAQLDKIGFCFDWSREVSTSDPGYYKWTQWIFLQLFDSWYNRQTNKAERIGVLVEKFQREGNTAHPCPGDRNVVFTADVWNSLSEKEQQEILMQYRIAFCGYGEVNWCEALGTVLANDEVINGVSERGGFPVVKKKLRQWYLRITEYADRLLSGLNDVEFSDSMKEMQSNWIGKSYGAEVDFVPEHPAGKPPIKVYTTRPDTIFGVDFLVLAPEHPAVKAYTSQEQSAAVEDYLAYVNSRSERERMAEKKITGVFTGSYCNHPFSEKKIPVWISEYVLAGYGTGAIMAVPCGDERDHRFANHFNIPITNIIGEYYDGREANPTKDAILENSSFLDGLVMKDAIGVALDKLEETGIGKRQVNYKMRDAAFSRQRYWGEPFPIVWKDGVAVPLPESELPVELPYLAELKPGPDAEGPLSNLTEWKNYQGGMREVNTMPGYAGSSWYFLRYMDADNDKEFCDRKASDYWGQVDLYIGGTEHAVGHLLYSRMWTKCLFDLGYIGFQEPFRKLVNQGMITAKSYFFQVKTEDNAIPAKAVSKIVSYSKVDESDVQLRFKYGHKFVDNNGRLLKSDYEAAIISGEIEVPIYEIEGWEKSGDEEYIFVREESEKMSKSKFNVENPDDIVAKYGADTFRMYEMFLGPIEMSKPWDTKGIEGVHRFLKKLWRLFYEDGKGLIITDLAANDAEWKVLYRMIKKVEEDTERFSFNTAVSSFMIGVNELSDMKCNKAEVLEKLLITLAPFAPHICEELWNVIGHKESILNASFPKVEEKYLVESSKLYPIAINGKTRSEMNIALDATQADVEAMVLRDAVVQKWLEGKSPKKIIYVRNKMINVVI
ncbi:leucine--tRNA ligase [Pollutibacter soli]|uniref:leucine--tRNA ligase n=1 Tax=Pollutibacter soli TaxID=3034157 RepID=UPI003013AF82